jgi:PKD repeat protein
MRPNTGSTMKNVVTPTAARLGRLRRATTGRIAHGQSLVEFALILPILLLIALMVIDFGRVYLGYVNVQSMARIAANYAANNASDLAPTPDSAVLAEYRRLVGNDARLINCELPTPLPGPVYAEGTDLGDPVTVSITCRFGILTPVIGAILGDDVLLTGSATFPVKDGAVTNVNNGNPVAPPPIANFLATPRSGYAPLTINVFDISENQPTSWVWDFGDGSTEVTRDASNTYDLPGIYTVTLSATNAGGTDSEIREAYVEVLERPLTDPVAEFSADVQVGPKPLTVDFTDESTGAPTTWLWEFGDGATSPDQNPTYKYVNAGSYNVSLTVTNADGSNKQTKTAFILVSQFPCVVPNFAGTVKNQAQSTWGDAGFTTTVRFLDNGNFEINYQSLPGGLTNPPNGCDATIEVGP